MSQSPENISSIIPIALDKGDRKIKGNDPNHIIDGILSEAAKQKLPVEASSDPDIQEYRLKLFANEYPYFKGLVESIKNSYSENKKHYEKGLVYFAGEYMNILDIIDIATNPNIGSNIGVEILLNEDEPDTRVVIITDKIYSYPKRTLTVTIKTNYSQDGNDIIPFNHNNPRPNQVYIKIEYKEMTGGAGLWKSNYDKRFSRT